MEVTHMAVLEVQHLNMGFLQVHLLPKLLHMMELVIIPLHRIKVNSQEHLHHPEFFLACGLTTHPRFVLILIHSPICFSLVLIVYVYLRCLS